MGIESHPFQRIGAAQLQAGNVTGIEIPDHVVISVYADAGHPGRALVSQNGPAAEERFDIDAVRGHLIDDGLVDASAVLTACVGHLDIPSPLPASAPGEKFAGASSLLYVAARATSPFLYMIDRCTIVAYDDDHVIIAVYDDVCGHRQL